MRVYIAFEFEGVEADSEMADTILNDVTKSCETMRIGLGADSCWVDDAQNTEEMDSFNNSFKQTDLDVSKYESKAGDEDSFSNLN